MGACAIEVEVGWSVIEARVRASGPAVSRRLRRAICARRNAQVNCAMEKPKKKSGAGEKKPNSPEQGAPFSRADVEHLSALQLCELISANLRESGANPWDLGILRDRVEELEEIQDQARTAVEQLSAVVEKLRAPALRIGTLIQRIGEDRALVCAGGTDYVCNVSPSLPEAVLESGMRVLLNEAFAV